MLTFTDAQKIIEEEFENIQFPSEPAALYDPVRYTISNGGKRIRPALVLLSANLFTDDIGCAIKPAMGIELFHNFTLLHDDLMDNSSIRRNNPTVHVKWNPNIAILSGDAMSIIANQYVSAVPAKIVAKVLEVFNRTAVEVCEGQMMDMAFEDRQEVRVQEYIRMIELKTSVLIACSLQIGALTAGSSIQDAVDLYEYGRNLGIAFQLQDDLLDAYGDPELFGKKIGNDIVTNKKTFLMINALKLATEDDLDELKSLISGSFNDPDEKIDKVKEIFDRTEVKKITEKKIDQYFQEALSNLAEVNVTPSRKKVLEDFSRELMMRKS